MDFSPLRSFIGINRYHDRQVVIKTRRQKLI
jgi:hypothetical protein